MRVKTLVINQCIMITAFNYYTILQHNDFICVANGGEAVGNYK